MHILGIVEPRQAKYKMLVAKCISNNRLTIKNSPTETIAAISQTLKLQEKNGVKITGIFVSTEHILKKFIARDMKSSVKLQKDKLIHNYQGAIFHLAHTYETGEVADIPVVILPDLKMLIYKPEASFMFKRWLSKLWDRKFPLAGKLEYNVLTEENAVAIYRRFQSPNVKLISIDIETKNLEVAELPDQYTVNDVVVPTAGMGFLGHPRTASGGKSARLAWMVPLITCVGYCAISLVDGKLVSESVVIPMDSVVNWHWMRKFNQLKAPKAMQRGIYDSMYFIRYNAPVYNWLYDTYVMMHSWYAELPRSLEFISSLFLRDHMYWKDESGMDLYHYNAKDVHATAWACFFMLSEWPDWAQTNYVDYFKEIFPTITCSVEGWRVDPKEEAKLRAEYSKSLEESQKWWDTTVCYNFNPGSYQQVIPLMKSRGFNAADSSDKTLEKFRYSGSLNDLLGKKIQEHRVDVRALGSYFHIDHFTGRVLFEIDICGTDTGRYASKASPYWCGTQIQNIPEYARSMYIADEGYKLSTADNSQSESRCTGYIAEEEKLIDAVENSRDFHTKNASLFFGIPEAILWDWYDAGDPSYDLYRSKIGKRLNHGANYNMGPPTLVDTMGAKIVAQVKLALALPSKWKLVTVAAHLLGLFDAAYPKIRSQDEGGYYKGVIDEIQTTHKLTGATGWTRYCFGDPNKNKHTLNSYVAHPPQSLSVKIINKSFYAVWKELQYKRKLIRLKAQVHDEIIWQNKPEHTAIVVPWISERMAQPTTVKGREMIIPNKPVTDKSNWAQLKH